MTIHRFDVEDAQLREDFLSTTVPVAIVGLTDVATPQWGRMSPQQMIEHLLWAVEVSTGKAFVTCGAADTELPRLRRFLYSNRATPPEFMNPALRNGLPPLRYETLTDAVAALTGELVHFLRDAGVRQQRHTHPVFGELTHEEWHRAHYKHAHHHLQQFALIAPA